jgi:hypothetical protein
MVGGAVGTGCCVMDGGGVKLLVGVLVACGDCVGVQATRKTIRLVSIAPRERKRMLFMSLPPVNNVHTLSYCMIS